MKMNIDEKIKRELTQQSSEIDNLLAEEKGLSDFIMGSIRSSLKSWFIVVNLITLVATLAMFWAGYEFYNTVQVNQQIFWGVCFLTSLMVQIALKQWIWSEMTRASLIREIKRVELSVSRQFEKYSK